MPDDFKNYRLFRRWHELTGDPINETMNRPLSLIYRWLEYEDIENAMRPKDNTQNGKPR